MGQNVRHAAYLGPRNRDSGGGGRALKSRRAREARETCPSCSQFLKGSEKANIGLMSALHKEENANAMYIKNSPSTEFKSQYHSSRFTLLRADSLRSAEPVRLLLTRPPLLAFRLITEPSSFGQPRSFSLRFSHLPWLPSLALRRRFLVSAMDQSQMVSVPPRDCRKRPAHPTSGGTGTWLQASYSTLCTTPSAQLRHAAMAVGIKDGSAIQQPRVRDLDPSGVRCYTDSV